MAIRPSPGDHPCESQKKGKGAWEKALTTIGENRQRADENIKIAKHFKSAEEAGKCPVSRALKLIRNGADADGERPAYNGEASTPQWLFDRCNQLALEACGEPLTLDVAAAQWNHKCERYYTEADDGLAKEWDAKAVFCNPPYTADIIEMFVRKAVQAVRHGTTTVMLIPSWNYRYLDLCEQHGRIHRICGPVTFKRQDGSPLTLNNGIFTSSLVAVVFGPTIQPRCNTPISKSPAPPSDGITVDDVLLDKSAAVTLLGAAEKEAVTGATTKTSYLHGGNASSPRPNTIPTPPGLCQFLHDLIAPHYPTKTILDPCAGDRALTKPWGKVKKIDYEILKGTDFFKCPDSIKCDLTLCNPPFNSDDGATFPPEQFFRRILKVVPPRTPIVLIVPMRFRLDQSTGSSRWRWLRDNCPAITSIISLPLNVFGEAVKVHAEILLFNMPKVKPHYFVPDEYLP